MANSMKKRSRGRPVEWPSRVRAPEAAIALYRAIAKAMRAPEAFETCHVYDGQLDYDRPVFALNGKHHGIAFSINSYLGLPYESKKCGTPNCVNPLHYSDPSQGSRLVVRNRQPEVGIALEAPVIEELREMVEYIADKNAIRKEEQTFERLRSLIPVEDITDFDLKRILEKP